MNRRCFMPWQMLLKLLILMGVLALLAGCAGISPQDPALDGSLAREMNPLDKSRFDELTLDELLQKGQEATNRGNLAAAVLFFAKAASKEPERPEPYAHLAKVHQRGGKPDEARKLYEQALACDPRHLPALLGAGRAVRDADRPAALGYFERAQAVAPDNAEVLTELAMTHELAKNLPAAEAHYRRALQQLPHAAGAQNNLGFNFLLQKRYAEAVVHLEKAHDLEPRDQQILNNLALAYFLLGQNDQALRFFTDSAGQAGAYNNLGCFYMMTGALDKADQAFVRAIELNPRYYLRAQKNRDRLRAMLGDQKPSRPVTVVQLQSTGANKSVKQPPVVRPLPRNGLTTKTP